MSDLPPIDEEYLENVLVELLNTPSPTGSPERQLRLSSEG
jgi:hypothetical protein